MPVPEIPDLTRREFLRTASVLACAPLLSRALHVTDVVRTAGPAGTAAAIDVRWLGDATPTAAAARRGAVLALEEARRSAQLFGGRIDWREHHGFAELGKPTGVSSEADGALRVYVTSTDAATTLAVAALARANGALHINATNDADSLRGRSDAPAVHVAPSKRSSRAALQRWLEREGATAGWQADGPDEARKGRDRASVVAWHPSLERFGAAQLNDRFSRRWHGATLDSASWCGWMSVKLAWDASLRAQVSDAAHVTAVLTDPAAKFDGHKGASLRVRPESGQLEQPLYVATIGAGSRVIGEVAA